MGAKVLRFIYFGIICLVLSNGENINYFYTDKWEIDKNSDYKPTYWMETPIDESFITFEKLLIENFSEIDYVMYVNTDSEEIIENDYDI